MCWDYIQVARDEPITPRFEELTCEVDARGGDPTGAVKGGRVRVKAKLKPVTRPPSSGELKTYKLQDQWLRPRWQLPLQGGDQIEYFLDFLVEPKEPHGAGGPESQLQMLLLIAQDPKGRYRQRSLNEDGEPRNLTGLLLFPVPNDEEGRFLRVGMFSMGRFLSRKEEEEYFFDAEEKIVTIV